MNPILSLQWTPYFPSNEPHTFPPSPQRVRSQEQGPPPIQRCGRVSRLEGECQDSWGLSQLDLGEWGGGREKFENVWNKKKAQINSVGWQHTRVDTTKQTKPRPVGSAAPIPLLQRTYRWIYTQWSSSLPCAFWIEAWMCSIMPTRAAALTSLRVKYRAWEGGGWK